MGLGPLQIRHHSIHLKQNIKYLKSNSIKKRKKVKQFDCLCVNKIVIIKPKICKSSNCGSDSKVPPALQPKFIVGISFQISLFTLLHIVYMNGVT